MKGDIDPRLMERLSQLQAAPERKPEQAERGRAAFLQQASDMVGAVTPPEKRRHNGWMHALPTIFKIQPKEPSPMFSTLSTIVLIVSLIVGGGGVTVAAAQASQPDQPLYGVKVWSEDVRLGMTAGTQSEWKLALQYTSRRTQEIRTMIQAGLVPPAAVQTRYQNQVEQAIRLAAGFPYQQALQAVEQVRTRLQTQLQAFQQEDTQVPPLLDEARLQTRQMLQERLQWTEEGLADPAQLRERLRLMNQQHLQDPQHTPASTGEPVRTGAAGSGAGNPWTTGTPTPGSSYGPGPGTGDCPDCTPVGTHAGPGQVGNPWTTGTPTPGSGYGPGPGLVPSHTCTPGSGYGPGPQPTLEEIHSPTQAGPHPTQMGPGPQHTPEPDHEPTHSEPEPPGPGPHPTGDHGEPGGNH